MELLNRSLAAALALSLASQIAQRHPNEEGIAPARIAARFIVAPPGDPELDAIVIVEDSEPVPDRIEAVGDRQRILAPAGQVDHRRAEDRPVASEAHPTAEANLLAVAQIFDRRVDVAVEAQIADRRIGPPAADRRVDLVAAKRETVLVDPEAVDEADQPAELHIGPPDDIGEAVGKAGAGG